MIMTIDRKMGFYPISIPTSLALESLTNTGEFLKEGKAEIENCECLMVNLRTLVRNAINAFGKDYERATIDVLAEAIVEDVSGIKQTLAYSGLNVELKLYYCDYTDLPNRFPNAKFNEPKTDRQKLYAETSAAVLAKLKDGVAIGETVHISDWRLSSTKDTYLLTHLPIDLLSNKNFSKLRLVESHTGRFKTPADFHTKLKLPKDTSTIPFNGLTLQIFGDGATFGVYDAKVKKKVLEASITNRWHLLTTETRIKDSLKLTDKFVYELVKNLVYS